MYVEDYNKGELENLQKTVAERALEASRNARVTLMAGFTTVRDVGSVDYIDVGLRNAILHGDIPGPRMLVSTRAIIATGSYAPKGFAPEFRVPQGAEEADGIDALIRIIRDQIARGADWIKFYADYVWGPGKGARQRCAADFHAG